MINKKNISFERMSPLEIELYAEIKELEYEVEQHRQMLELSHKQACYFLGKLNEVHECDVREYTFPGGSTIIF